MARIRAVAALNNSISAKLAFEDMVRCGIDLTEVALILLRDIHEPWMKDCAFVVRYPGRPSNRPLDQWRFVSFYRSAAKLLSKIEASGGLDSAYIVNNDNLVSTHLLALADRMPGLELTVVAEGLMNYQEIELKNRASWRWRAKPIAATLLGLSYHQPSGHLSGSYEALVRRVVSFAREGLKAPAEKVELIAFPQVAARRVANPRIALVALTGLCHWMPAERFGPFAHAFVDWLNGQRFEKIYVKPHPRVSAGFLEEILPTHAVLNSTLSLEDMAPDLEAGTVVGTCCTALVTLKLIRPDLRCIDFGSEYYSLHAYSGDRSVETLLRAAGVELVQMSRAEPSTVSAPYPRLHEVVT